MRPPARPDDETRPRTWDEGSLMVNPTSIGPMISSQTVLPQVDEMVRWIDQGPADPANENCLTLQAQSGLRKKHGGGVRTSTSLPNLPCPAPAASGPSASSKLRRAGFNVRWLKTKPAERGDSLAAVARANAIREDIHRHLLAGRVPTPEWAAKRELPSIPLQLPMLTHDEPPSYGWQPPGAAARLGEAYFYHEPGGRVRRNLATLKHWRDDSERWRRDAARLRASVRRSTHESKRLVDQVMTRQFTMY